MASPLLVRLAVPLRAARSLWRRSLQWRVVMSTLVLSALVAALVGWVLQQQVTGNIIESKQEQALSEAAAGTTSAQRELDSYSPAAFDARSQLTDLVNELDSRGEASEQYTVVMVGPINANPDIGAPDGDWRDSDVSLASVPSDMRKMAAMAANDRTSDATSWAAYTRLSYIGGRQSVPALAVGSRVTLPDASGTTYLLVYLFSLEEQEQTIGVVRRAMLTAGSLLVLLMGGVAYLVIRQVVTPVRLARRIAERLAAGRLEERMLVRGEDDLARLGTSFNQMATSLQRQIRQLEELSRVQRRFVSDVSHELRTPLTTVRMAADVLHEARDRFDGSTARSAELLQNELDRFESLLNDLLEISRFDAGAAILELETVDLVEVAERVISATQPLAERHGTRLNLHAPKHPCAAEADVRRIERIVRNLMFNAVEHSEGRDVDVYVASSHDAAALSIRDHGTGLAPGQAALVFNRFWRADPARTRTSGGSGLGLSISLEDARLHGGWLQAWGEPGEGTLFRLTLPRLAGEEPEASPLPLVPEDVGMRERARNTGAVTEISGIGGM